MQIKGKCLRGRPRSRLEQRSQKIPHGRENMGENSRGGTMGRQINGDIDY
jgi:hypothetical protein